MFIYQGQKSFYLWNKINPEIDNELLDLLISSLSNENRYNRIFSSGKSTVSKLLSFKRGPLFSADRTVKELYVNNHLNL